MVRWSVTIPEAGAALPIALPATGPNRCKALLRAKFVSGSQGKCVDLQMNL